MKDFVYIAPSFAREECTKSIMSIRYSAGGLSFSIRKENEILFLFSRRAILSSYDERYVAFQNALKSHGLDGLVFEKVELYDATAVRLLMPQEEYNSDRRDIWLKTLFDSAPTNTFCVNDTIDACNATLVSYHDNQLKSNFSEYGKYVTICSLTSSFIKNSIASVPAKNRGYWLFVEYSKGCADLLLMKGKDVIFYNVYSVSGSEELLFYVLKVMEMYGVTGAVNAVFSGETMSADDLIFATLKRYIPTFSMAANVVLKSICNNENIEVMPLFVHLIN